MQIITIIVTRTDTVAIFTIKNLSVSILTSLSITVLNPKVQIILIIKCVTKTKLINCLYLWNYHIISFYLDTGKSKIGVGSHIVKHYFTILHNLSFLQYLSILVINFYILLPDVIFFITYKMGCMIKWMFVRK